MKSFIFYAVVATAVLWFLYSRRKRDESGDLKAHLQEQESLTKLSQDKSDANNIVFDQTAELWNTDYIDEQYDDQYFNPQVPTTGEMADADALFGRN